MLGKRNRKKDAVQIDVDWLLGESTAPSEKRFPWFRNLSLFLVAVLAILWCWPIASRQWLNWELQRQLTNAADAPSEDVLPIMLAIHELNPDNSEAMVEQLANVDASKRLFAFHFLEERIQQWRQTSNRPHSAIAILVNALHSERLNAPASLYLRAQLATQLKPLVDSKHPNATKLIASIDRMLALGEPAVQADERSRAPEIKQIAAPVLAASYRITDHSSQSGDPTGSQAEPSPVRIAGPSQGHVLTSMRTATDPPVSVATNPSLPIKLSIPRTAIKGVGMQITDSVEHLTPPSPVASVSAAETMTYHHEPISINGIEKLELEKLLPLLHSSQTKIERQAFNELVRREIPQSIVELAIVMAQGETEERLRAMEAIARAPQNNPIPWLAWMAENADRDVRRRAIALLGSMTDPEAMHKLRALQSREPDSALVDQINQVLLASGTASRSVR